MVLPGFTGALRVLVRWWLAALVAGAATPAWAALPGRVVAWGNNLYGQATIPFGLTNIVAVAGGSCHSLVLTANGTVLAWGTNYYGPTTNVPLSLTDAVAIAAGDYHNLALTANGAVVAWGYNANNQTNVPAGLKDAMALAAGGYHSLALRSNGTVLAWGSNIFGQTNVPPNLTNVAAIAAGESYSLALRSNGTVLAWGQFWNGSNYVAMTSPAGLANVASIAAGAYHSLVVLSNGSAVAWGNDVYGQTNIPSGLSNVIALAGGSTHSLGLTSGGTAVAWGGNASGQTNVPAGLSNVVAIAAGANHSLALTLSPLIATSPPPAISLPLGATTNLYVEVLSGIPFTCQWSLNGVAITSATTTRLVLTNFGLPQAGIYSVVISNAYGSIAATTVVRLTNSPAVLVDAVDVGGGSVTRFDSSQVSMSSTFGPTAHLYYTLDGSAPDFQGTPYSGPFILTNRAVLRAIAYNSAYTMSAEAAAVEIALVPTFPLIGGTAGGGSVSASPTPYDANRYISNTVITLTATPASGWSFLGWTGDLTGTSNVLSFAITEPTTLRAVFGASLTLLTNGNGQILLNPPSGPYPFGSSVRLTALPGPDSYFFGWAGSASGFSNVFSLTVTAVPQVTALFGLLRASQVSLVVLPTGNGAVVVAPAVNVFTNGDIVQLAAYPGPNAVFTGWGGGASGTLNPLTLTLASNTVVVANFAAGSATNPPVITQAPMSRTLGDGGDLTLSVQATGDGPLSYQWRFDGYSIPGATSSSLELRDIAAGDAGLYDVVVTGAAGQTTSRAAAIAVLEFGVASSASGGVPILVLSGASGTSYRLETCSDLSLANWTLLTPIKLQSGSFYYVDEPITNHPARFYHAVPQ